MLLMVGAYEGSSFLTTSQPTSSTLYTLMITHGELAKSDISEAYLVIILSYAIMGVVISFLVIWVILFTVVKQELTLYSVYNMLI
jgi:hypothetical protein